MVTLIVRKGKTDLNISLRIKNENINNAIALGINVSKSRWKEIQETISMAKASRSKGKTVFIDDMLISQLFKLIIRVKNEVDDNINDVYPIIDEIFHKTKPSEKKRKSPAKEPFVDFVESYIQDLKDGKILARGKSTKVRLATIDTNSRVLKKLIQYQAYKHRILHFKDIDIKFSSDFKAFLVADGLMPNTINIYMSRIKTIMRNAHERKLTNNTDYLISSFGSPKKSVDNVYVTQERIDELYNHNFLRIKQNITRDVFVFACETGQRFSDFIRISLDDIVVINEREFFHIYQKKTSQEVFIPVTSRAREILERYGGHLPDYKYTSLTYNLEMICEIMGWEEYVKSMGKKFYRCVTSHTARRSFATNAYKRGVPLSAIMAVTGHTSESMLRKYLKLDNEEKAILAAQYFK